MYDLLNQLPDRIARLEKRYREGDPIIDPNEDSGCLYILVSGKAAVYNLGVDGEELNLCDYEAVDCFGEIELLCGKRYPLLVRAKTDCSALLVPQRDFLQWLRGDPDFSLFLLRRMSEKLLYNSDRMSRLSLLTMRERYLLSMQSHLIAGDLPTLTKARVAEEICAPPRSLNRLVAENSALVRYTAPGFQVLDPAGLRIACERPQMMLWQASST